jgi:hypothetical protein
MGNNCQSASCGKSSENLNTHNVYRFMQNLLLHINQPDIIEDIQKYKFAASNITQKIIDTYKEVNYYTLQTPNQIVQDNLNQLLCKEGEPFKPYFTQKEPINPPLSSFFKMYRLSDLSSFYSGFCINSNIKEWTTCVEIEPPQQDGEEKPKSPSRRLLSFMPHGYGCLLVDVKTHIKLFEGFFENGDFREGYIIDVKYIYIGSYSKEGYDGVGTLYWSDGKIYKGNFKNGHLNGDDSFMYLPMYYIFQGKTVMGMIKGAGIMKFLNPQTKCIDYKGEFNDGVPFNYGVMNYKDGSKYEGYWKDGLYNGKGKLTSSNEVYDGEFMQGKRHGHGVYSKFNSETNKLIESFTGTWKYDEKYGKGSMCYYNEKGDKIEKVGVWKSNKFEREEQ